MMNTANQDVWDVKRFLAYCAEVHPKARIQDYVKRLHQSEFGTDYDIQDEEKSLSLLRKEIEGMTDKMKRRSWFDPFCSNFCRMHLSISAELPVELIHRIFLVSNKKVPRTAWFRFEEKLRIFWEMVQEQSNMFRFSEEETKEYLKWYRDNGYPVVSHSEEYKRAYEPAYRVVRKEYGWYVSLYTAIEDCLKRKGSVNIAIDGNCGAGKTEAAKLLSTLWDCNIFPADHFFLPLEKRTPQRMAEVGGNMERERYREEICEMVKKNVPFSYRPLNCSVMEFGEPIQVSPKKVNIFEGTYSMHPDLREYYDVTVFLSVSPAEQEARILERNGRFMLRRYLDEWIPKENAYFEEMKIRDACQFVY